MSSKIHITIKYLGLFFAFILSLNTHADIQDLGGGQLKFTYQSENFCDLHYKINGGGQLNVAMSNLGNGNYEYIVNNLSSNDQIDFYYTYQQNGLAYDTPWDNHTVGNASGSSSSGSGSSSSGSSSSGGGQAPYSGTAIQIPGNIIEAENFDLGGQNLAYYDNDANNNGGAYRTEQVDIENKAGGGYNVGWFSAGEWLEYTINVTSPGTYEIKANYAVEGPGGSFHVEFTGATTAVSNAITVSNTGNWQWWNLSSGTSVNLNAGEHTMRFAVLSGGFNVDHITLTPVSNNNGGDLPVAYPGYTGDYPGFTLKYDDRFDTFNNDVWARGDGAVGTESDCRFTPQGVQVNGGLLELVIRNEYIPASWSNDHQAWKGAYNYSCGELRTKPAKRIKYGRIETRMKAPQRTTATGYISSLFTYVNEGSPREWEEIDVELEGGRPDKFQANLIYGYDAPSWSATRNWGAWEHKIDTGPVDQWRVFAIEWTPSEIRWYVDGNLVKVLNQNWIDCNPSCVYPQIYYTPIPDNLTELMMNFWIPNDAIQDAFGGNKGGNVYPMTTQYDWVRFYELDSHPWSNW